MPHLVAHSLPRLALDFSEALPWGAGQLAEVDAPRDAVKIYSHEIKIRRKAPGHFQHLAEALRSHVRSQSCLRDLALQNVPILVENGGITVWRGNGETVIESRRAVVAKEVVVPGQFAVGAIILDLSDVNATRLLDMLVKQRPLYVWHRDDIVYNLYPMRKSKSLAQVSIADFVVADATLQQVHAAISNLPEVRRWVMRHHAITVGAPGSGSIVSTAGVMPEPKRISLNLHNVQLCTILNQVIRGFGKWQWVIGTYPQVTGASESLYIDF
jgi:hypothetical protein